MGRIDSLRIWGLLAAASLGICAAMGAAWQQGANPSGHHRMLLPGDTYGESRPARARTGSGREQTYQRLESRNGILSAEYGFINFNKDLIRLGFSIPAAEFAAYRREYGYTEGELEDLKQWQKKALNEALQHAQKNRLSQEDLNRMGEKIRAEYKAKHLALLQSRGFVKLPGNLYAADICGIARRNVKRMRPLSLQLSAKADKSGYGSDEIIGMALSLVQTPLLYDAVPMTVEGRQTGGVYPPVETLVKGKGDCDTKSALLAAILLNWDRMNLIGINVPNHYLMGVLRNPQKGDLFVEYNGLRYVLLEPAGPAWLPAGMVGAETKAMLKAGKELRIEPLSAN